MNPPGDRGQLPDELDALLYDWHNALFLESQLADAPHWCQAFRDADSIAVLGAGTGRVASLLAGDYPGRLVLAVDRSAARLLRAQATGGLKTTQADFRTLSTATRFDAVLFPYSTLQMLESAEDRAAAVRTATRILRPEGSLGIDLSTSFEKRQSGPWRLTASGPCPGLATELEEWELLQQGPGALTVIRRYRGDGEDLGQATERWSHYSSLQIQPLLESVGLGEIRVSSGYNDGSSKHRRLYHAMRC